MKMWQESDRILERLQSAHEAGTAAAVAVLVRIEGSSYRRPGAKLLVAADGTSLGSISGGCLEEDVRQIGLEVLVDATPRQLRYKTGSDDETVWGLGLGCDGIVDLFVFPATSPAVMSTVPRQRELFRGDAAFSVATIVRPSAGACQVGSTLVLAAGTIAAGGSGDAKLDEGIRRLSTSAEECGTGLYSLGEAMVFLEKYIPPPSLFVFGAGDDAIPLARLAADMGFRVALVDHRAAYLTKERFPEAWRLFHVRDAGSIGHLPLGENSLAVVKTHSLNRDAEWVRALVSVPLSYVGLLGPRDRRLEILSGISDDESRSVYGPVGLDLGAEGPDQVGLSVVAELLAVVSGRSGGHLRDCATAIHPDQLPET